MIAMKAKYNQFIRIVERLDKKKQTQYCFVLNQHTLHFSFHIYYMKIGCFSMSIGE